MKNAINTNLFNIIPTKKPPGKTGGLLFVKYFKGAEKFLLSY